MSISKAVIDSRGEVLGEVVVPADVKSVRLCGGFAADGTPVNWVECKLSSDKRKIRKAERECTDLYAQEYKGHIYLTVS